MSFTSDIDDAFFPRLIEVCTDLQCEPLHLMSVMMSEAGVRADAWNDNPKTLPPEQRWNASGLIQFMPATLIGLGWAHGHAAFRQLSATDQLPWVRAYFAPHRGKLVSIGAIYTATFLPALLSHAGDSDFVLTAKNGPLGWAYSPNAAFDANHDLAITVGELELAVVRNCHGPRWAELVSRLTGKTVDVNVVDDSGLRTTLGIQRALSRLGFSPGPLDGIPGPRTHDAVVAFQSQRGLVADGIVGPITREALIVAIATAQ